MLIWYATDMIALISWSDILSADRVKVKDSFKYSGLHSLVKATFAVNESLCYLKYNEMQSYQSNDVPAAAFIYKVLVWTAADIYTPFRQGIIKSGNKSEKSYIKSNASMCGSKQCWKCQQPILIIKFVHKFCAVYLPQRQKYLPTYA